MGNFDWIHDVPQGDWKHDSSRASLTSDYSVFLDKSGLKPGADLRAEFDEWALSQPRKLYLTTVEVDGVPSLVGIHYLKA